MGVSKKWEYVWIHSKRGILHATKAQGPGTVFAGSHQQVFAMLIEFEGLREVPRCILRLVVTATAQNGGAGVFISKFIGPLPNMAYHVFHPKRAGPLRMLAHGFRRW